MKKGYLVWNVETRRVGCRDIKTRRWLVEGFHCGDSFIVADGDGFNTDNPQKWTGCHLERLYGDWGDGEGYILVSEDEPITEPRWIGYRRIMI